MTVGLVALAATAALGAYLHLRPGLNAVDRLGFTLPPASTQWWHFFRVVTRFGTWPALAVGSVSAATVAWYTGRRDRWRALACLIGPPAAAVLDQFVIKPLVGRLYQGELSFASGSVTVIAAVGTAWVLAVPRRFRPAAAVVGSLSVALMIVAVIALRWHYPTDALAGIVLGVGMVLIVDRAAHSLAGHQSGGNAFGGRDGAGHSTNSSRALRTPRGRARSLLVEGEGGTVPAVADEPDRGIHRPQLRRIGQVTDPSHGLTHWNVLNVVAVISAVRSVGYVGTQRPVCHARRALSSSTRRWSAQAFAEGFELEAATGVAPPIGRG